MSKKKKAKSRAPHCGGCKNFRATEGKSGVCKRKDTKRSRKDKACSHYDPV